MRIYLKHCLCYMFVVGVFLCHVILQYVNMAPYATASSDAYYSSIEKPRIMDISSTIHDSRTNRALPDGLYYSTRTEGGGGSINVIAPHPAAASSDVKKTSGLTDKAVLGVLLPPTAYPGDSAAQFNGPSVARGTDSKLWINPGYHFNCTNVHRISVKRKLGHGVSKQVYLGLVDGRRVAVKMVTRTAIDVTSCVKRMERDGYKTRQDKQKCYVFPNMKLMKEILLLHQLDHANLLRLLGYCVRSEETDSTSLHDHGVLAVYEYALRFYLSTLKEWPLRLRLKTALELADLLDYFENSPLGSLRIADFKDAHFLLVNDRIKLTDLDDVTSAEPTCTEPGPLGEDPVVLGGREPLFRDTCRYGLACVGGICSGYNAKFNLDRMNQMFFQTLLGDDWRPLEELRQSLTSLSVTARQVKQQLSKAIRIIGPS
jgi:hypothetical protein